MTDTLIARLRNGNLFADRVEAANLIEALHAELKNEQRKVTELVNGYEADAATIKELRAEVEAWKATHIKWVKTLEAERDTLQSRLTALEGQDSVIDKQMLWLWKNGDHFLAFDNLYPCFTQGGDPMTLGEPAARAIFRTSFGREARLAAGAAPTKEQK